VCDDYGDDADVTSIELSACGDDDDTSSIENEKTMFV